MPEFPQYRKYSNDKSFFRLTSWHSFDELNIIGRYYRLFTIEVKQLPERNLLADLIDAADEGIIIITPDDFDAQVDLCVKTKELIG